MTIEPPSPPMTSKKTISFKEFLSTWNNAQGQSTPYIHFRMGEWLEKMLRQKERFLLLMAFRACGKSTVTGLYIAWRLFRNPNLRILIISADDILAGKMVRNVKRILERHIWTQHLKPDAADQWGADRFTVTRAKELRDPSVLARGISANMTGSRADIIICDDVEVPNTCDTSAKREDLRVRLSESDFILTPRVQKSTSARRTPITLYTAQRLRPIMKMKRRTCRITNASLCLLSIGREKVCGLNAIP